VTHSQGGTNKYNSNVSSFEREGETPKILTFTQDSAVGKKVYINGILASESNNTDKLSNISTLPIGKNYYGEIGEVVAFNRSLDNIERQEVEEYLSAKWAIKNSPNVECTDGTVSGSECILGTCSVDLIGTTTYLVNSGSGTVSCNATGYSGSVSYTCAGGTFTGSSSCSCASGYGLSGSYCVRACPVSVTGSTTTTVVTGGSDIACDQTGYSGTFTNNCSSGETITGTCNCASGYTLSGGACVKTCPVSVTGSSTTSTLVGAAAITCDQAGYSGTVANSCNNSGTAVTGTCGCASGYSWNGSSCNMTAVNGRWTLITSTVRNAGVTDGSYPTSSQSLTCTNLVSGKFTLASTMAVLTNSYTLSSSPYWDLHYWIGNNCWCSGSDSCNLPSGCSSRRSSTTTMRVYRCDYP